MRRLALLVGLFFVISLPAAADGLPKFELYGGYGYSHFDTSDSNSGNTNGWDVSPSFFPFKYVGLTVDAGGSYSNGYTQSNGSQVDASNHSGHYTIGPRVRFGIGRITPFGDVLFGVIARDALVNSSPFTDASTDEVIATGTTLSKAQIRPAIGASGGVDFKLLHHLAFRAQVGWSRTDYSVTSFASPGDPISNAVTFGTGLVIE